MVFAFSLARRRWCVLVVLAAGALAHAGADGKLPALRELPKEVPYVLRTVYLEDPRLPTWDFAQRSLLYARLEALLAQWFGYTVKITETGRHDLATYFARHGPVFRRHAEMIAKVRIDIDQPGGMERTRQAISMDFRRRELAQIDGYLRLGGARTHTEAVEAAAAQFERNFAEIRQIRVGDGDTFWSPVRPELNSYPHWCALQYDTTEADFILTNTMIVGPDAEMPIYVISRGGITLGNTNNNPHTAFQGTTVVGLFPFLSDAPYFLRERGRIPEAERMEAVAMLCLHELGHLLVRCAEYYDHPHCVHVAPVRLEVLSWYRALKQRGPCRLPHQKVSSFSSAEANRPPRQLLGSVLCARPF
ncbi:MAG: hypothetical protein HZC55_18070 [Verrucomicrobia bacterium]|nr:hypothetical protein [Verrucomicrobiota bacterium]